MRPALLLALFAGLLPQRLPALSSSLGPSGLGAASLGAGGAVVATVQGAEALDWNPAGLASPGWDLAYGSGQGGPLRSVQQGLGVAGSLDGQVGLGLRLGDLAFPQADYREDGAGLGLALRAGPWLSLGLLQKLLSAEPGGLRGWSMDLGGQACVPLGGDRRLRIGASLEDAASSLAWADGLEEIQPTVLRLGVALEAAPGTWVELQQDHLDRQGRGGVDQWRAGLQVPLWEGRVDLRGGATQAAGDALYLSGGLGVAVPWAGQRLALDYAALVPVPGSGVAAWRQVASLRWTFGLPVRVAEVKAGLAQTLTDKDGRLRLARILVSDAPKDSRAWELDLHDAKGRVVKAFKGQGVVPPSLVWDGRDGHGVPIQAAGLSYELRTTGPDGQVARRQQLLKPSPPEVLAALAAVEGGAYGLRSGPKGSALPVPQLRLKGGELEVSAADFNVAAVAGDGTKAWELRIVDAGGRTVKRIQGRGRPPHAVRWEGTDDLGRPVAVSLGASYEIRVTDAGGKERLAVAAPVVQQAAFEQAVARAAEPKSRAPEVLHSSCERDPLTGRLACSFEYALHISDLGEHAAAVLAKAADEARAAGYTKVRIEGWATGEGDRSAERRLAQRRADHVMEVLLGTKGLHLKTVVVRGLGEGGARRVELTFDR